MLSICVVSCVSLCFHHNFMVDWQCLCDYCFAPLAKINAVCSLQLSPREGHDFNLLYMFQKAMACIAISCGNPFLLWDLVAHCPCPYSKAVQELVLPQEFGGRWEGAKKKKGRQKMVH